MFGDFWDAYGLKRDRIAAERVWNRLSAGDRTAAVAGIPAYREDCRRRGIAMMYGQGYLSHRRWEDEAGQPCNGLRLEAAFMDETESLPAGSLDDMDIW